MSRRGGFDHWLHRLATLRIDRARGNPAPHKPFLLLVDNGADVNAKTARGGTPLMHAVGAGQLDVAEFLKKHGATE